MNWFSVAAHSILSILLVSAILYWADIVIPMGALLVLVLLISVVMIWMIAALLKDDDLLTHFFDD